MDDLRCDVVVVGGGAAGLSGALILARALRSVVVVDAGEPRNAVADGVHGFLTRDGMAPRDFLRAARQEVTGYGGRIVDGIATSVRRAGDGFTVGLTDGRTVTARKVLAATGLVDELPDVAGLAERWGRDVLQCPYCHGWEVRGQRIGVLAHPASPVEQALLFSQWSPAVTLFLHESQPLAKEERERLDARDIGVVEGRVERVEVEDDRLVGVRLVDGTRAALDALALEPRYVARTDLFAKLGLRPSDHPMGERLTCTAPDESPVPGVWVAGNVTDIGGQVVGAVADGARAGIAINSELLQEDVQRAVEARRRREAPVA